MRAPPFATGHARPPLATTHAKREASAKNARAAASDRRALVRHPSTTNPIMDNGDAGEDKRPVSYLPYLLTSLPVSSKVRIGSMSMQITFWGVRGSIPTPGRDTVEIGGNTSCVELRAGKALVILDGGTGLRLLGQKLLKEMPFTAHIFFSHVHWDHIQGFPFFAPAFVPGNTIHLYGGNNVSRTLEETLAGQMDYPSFPVQLGQLGSKMAFADLTEGQVLELDAGNNEKLRVTTGRGNHPNGVWAYRLEYQGKTAVYATDTEHYSVIDPKLLALSKNADLLIYDSQYTPEEYAGTSGGGSKVGWGHSTIEEAAKLAKAANVKKLVLFHHDPLQSDAAVREKERRTKEWFANAVAAHEGLTLDV
jgi:phosphoribosyl 1,2-cyclic phosphodiesterase